VILTDAELDHTLGLLHLREGAGWAIHATQPVLEMLDADLRVTPALAHYGRPALAAVDTRAPLLLGPGERQVAVHWLETGQDPPRYAQQRGVTPWAVSALLLEDLQSGRKIAYAPGVAQLDGPLLERLSEADAILIDGTFWSDDEFPRVGGVPRTAADMGHAPIGGSGGTAELLGRLPASTKLYVHINNTNPVLDPGSEARQFIRDRGLEVAEDGAEVTV
jgi:pyrroloquinoline quinone biosynthesis protein B